MELRQLGYFLAVAQEENFTRAAQRLNVAQPGISQQIRRLERDLGEELFDRSGHAVRLTEAGRAFLPHARSALAAADGGRAALAELRGLLRGRLVLGTIPGVPDLELGDLLSQFHRRHPAVEVTMREDQPDPLIDGVRRGELDAAFIGLGEPVAPPGLEIEVATVEPLVLVTPPGHPLGDRASVTIDMLRDVPLVTLNRGSSHRRTIEKACSRAGFAARITLETSDCDLLTDLVAHGLGVTVLPVSIAAAGIASGRLRAVEVTKPRLDRCTVLAWRAGTPPTPAARAFVALGQEVLASRALPRRAPSPTPNGRVGGTGHHDGDDPVDPARSDEGKDQVRDGRKRAN